MNQAAIKRKLFVEHFLSGRTAEEAAHAAGWTGKNLGMKGRQMLEHPEVQTAICERVKAAAVRAEIRLEAVVSELGVIAFAALDDEHVKVADKRGALDSLMRYFGAFDDHVHHTHDVNVRHAYEFSDDELAAFVTGRAPGVGSADTAVAPTRQ